MSNIPKVLIRIAPQDPKFAEAYGGLVALYPRPAVVTEVHVDDHGVIAGFKYAPLTSSLDTSTVSPAILTLVYLKPLQCEVKAWATVDWGDARVDSPLPLHQDVEALYIPLCRRRPFKAKASHVWIKDWGEYISTAEWNLQVRLGWAKNWDRYVRLDELPSEGCRASCAAIRECQSLLCYAMLTCILGIKVSSV